MNQQGQRQLALTPRLLLFGDSADTARGSPYPPPLRRSHVPDHWNIQQPTPGDTENWPAEGS